MKGETMHHHKKKKIAVPLAEKNHEVGVVETRNICKALKSFHL
jgi:hypothetical protein